MDQLFLSLLSDAIASDLLKTADLADQLIWLLHWNTVSGGWIEISKGDQASTSWTHQKATGYGKTFGLPILTFDAIMTST